jgi:transcriptional regulator with XRE-family HTH domain
MDTAGVGVHLRQVRTERGMSQSALERASGIPKARLSRYEHGHVEPRMSTLAQITESMGVSLPDFLRGMP